MIKYFLFTAMSFVYLLNFLPEIQAQDLLYPIVDTNVKEAFSNDDIISIPVIDADFYGQDANYLGLQPSYSDNGNGIVMDNVTGLMWEKDMGTKITFEEASLKADTLTLGGFDDWRIPAIKELYSLIDFNGRVMGAEVITKFINTDYFNQPIGDESLGERQIDAQTWTSTHYKSTTMRGDSTIFGVNFLDGRIKGYPKYNPGSNNTVPRAMYFRMVRGNLAYGQNDFVDNGDGSISDNATGLMWQKADDGQSRNWQEALEYAEGLELAAYDNWRLPNAKELQGIIDYNRCPDITFSAAIDPKFETTEILDPDGNEGQYPYFWTGTTHKDGPNPYSGAVYLAFGEAQGEMNVQLLDVHGAGSQRSDPKTGNKADYPQYHGPQGDVRYVYNYVRCVRDIDSGTDINNIEKSESSIQLFPNPANDFLRLDFNSYFNNIEIEIMDISGSSKAHYLLKKTNKIQLDLRILPEGLYMIRIKKDGKISQKSFIKAAL